MEKLTVTFNPCLLEKDYRLHALWTIGLVAVYIMAFVLVFSDDWYKVLPASAFLSVCCVHGFVIAHECSHRNWFRRKRWNSLCGHLLLLPTLIPYSSFRYYHALHHSKTHDLEYDDVWTPVRLNNARFNRIIIEADYLIRSYLHFLGPLLQTFFRHYRLSGVHDKLVPRFRKSILLSCVYIVTATFLLVFHPTQFLFGVLVPLIVFHQTFAFLGLFQHGATIDPAGESWTYGVKSTPEHQFKVTCDSPLPGPLEAVVLWSNYHVSHHLNVQIPFYNNRKAHEYLASCHTDYLRTNPMSWHSLKRNAKNNKSELIRKRSEYRQCSKAIGWNS